MFTKSKLFAAFLLSASTGAVALAQTPQRVESFPRIESPQVQVFTNNGSYLGVQSQDVTRENFAKFGLREVRGVAVERVLENSPAAQAGLQSNDVIVRFNGEEVTSARKLTRLIGEVAPDHQARITVLRGGNERELTATMGKRPAPTFESTIMRDWEGLPGIPEFPRTPATPRTPVTPRTPAVPRTSPLSPGTRVVPNGDYREFFSFSNSRQIGVGVAALNQQLGEYFGVADGRGVLVNNVRENSPAAKAGLRAGDVIVEVDGKAVARSLDLTRAVNEKKEGDVNLTIVRNKNRQTVRVTPEKMQGGGSFQLQEFFRDEDGNSRQPLRRLSPPRRVAPVMPGAPIQVSPSRVM